MPIYSLPDEVVFPPASEAEEDGLLAVGGDLRPERLIVAYASGIFPWPHEGLPLLWFSPDPRMVLPVDELTVSRRLERTIRSGRFEVRLDSACRQVIEGCALVDRRDEDGTWITPGMIDAYSALHELGLVHSAEAWRDGELVGGLYGMSLGDVFTGESMFALESNASKVAFVALVRQLARWGFSVFDAQVYTDHVARFGAREWPREQYLATLTEALEEPTRRGRWSIDGDLAHGSARDMGGHPGGHSGGHKAPGIS